MINAAIVNKAGIVTNVVVLSKLSDIKGAVLCPPHISIGMNIKDPEPQPVEQPAPQEVAQTQCSALEFIEKFTDEEQLAIVTEAMTIPAVRLWYDKLIASTKVIFADPRLNSGLDTLVSLGLITPERKLEILPNGSSGVQTL